QYKFMFLSSEWPEYLCSDYNDTFYSLYTSNGITGGAPKNISFDPQDREITVNVGFFEEPANWTVPLGNTPFGDPGYSSCNFSPISGCNLPSYCNDGSDVGFIGSGSGWLVTRSPVDPNDDTVELVLSIHDETDGILDSMVIFDSF